MAAKVTISEDAYQNVQEIYKMVDDLTNINSQAVRTLEGTNIVIDFPDGIKPENQLKANEERILTILANGGEIEGYLFGIKQPSSSISTDVPEDVRLRLFKGGGVRNFLQWFANNAQTWINNVTDEIMYYTDPNPSGADILDASEAKKIKDINPGTFTFHTIAEVQEILKPGGVPDPNWNAI